MKPYKILMSAALAVCLFSSCEDFLNIKPLNDIVLENFWDEKSDVDNMISGLLLHHAKCRFRISPYGLGRSPVGQYRGG